MKPSQCIVSIIIVFWVKGVSLSNDKVFQTPSELIKEPNGEATLSLEHQIQSYDTILWYQRSAGDTSLKLIGYMYYGTANMELLFKSHFNVSGNGEKRVYLHILKLGHPEHSAEYFGAANVELSSLKIQQSPENLLIRPGQQEARLECFHGDNSFPYMLWYRHRSAAGGQPRDMDLIGLLHYENADVEKTFATERFNITGHSKGRAQLTISNMQPADSAEYFCAARSTVCHLLRLLYKKLQ
ncbi:T cell receptor beta variable 18 [Dissostichus eleginoides]|nr:T cell receptor beta variable 18 [Dissostichus eleginoides]